MIVKDEAHVLPRCLGALKPHIDCALIIDTGSTDNTKELIPTLLDEVTVEEEPFQSFQHNRSRLLARAREVYPDADFHLMIDADDTFSPREDFEWPELKDDCYLLRHTLGPLAWWRPQLFRASRPFYYTGSAHEIATCDEPYTIERLPGITVRCGSDGARRKNEPVKKYERVAGILEKEVEKNPQDRRSTFYLAQSYRDAGQAEKALEMYERRAEMGGWGEEIWYSKHQIARIKSHLERPFEEVLADFVSAYEARPTRAESLSDAAFLCRRNQRFSLAYIYAAAAISIPYPETDRLFVDYFCYAWRRWDEYAMACWHHRRFDEAIWANWQILSNPEAEGYPVERMLNNITHCCRAPKEHFDKLHAVWEGTMSLPTVDKKPYLAMELRKDKDLRPLLSRIRNAIERTNPQ